MFSRANLQATLKSKAQELNRWADDASTRVKQIAGSKQEEIMTQMKRRINEVANTTTLPPAPPVKKAITESVASTEESASTAMVVVRKQRNAALMKT